MKAEGTGAARCPRKKARPPAVLKRRGVTLVELVVTIVVVGIVAIPLSLTLSQHIRSAFQAQDAASSRNIGRFELERALNTPYNNISSASFSNYSGYGYDVVRTVTYAQGNSGTPESLKKIVVDVRKSGEPTVFATLVTYVAKNVNYGL